MKPTVGIVGGGILGMTAAYRLAQAGVAVTLYERAPDLGGLVGSFDFDGTPVDRFYHVVLPSDHRVVGLADELGLGDKWRFRPTKVGFYGDGRLFSMTSPKEFLTFPLLRPHERARLAAFVARCQLTKEHDKLDDEPLDAWLRRHCGRGVVEKLWQPLLDSKFDGRYDDLPATYIWARTRRMGSTRDKSGREVMGWLEGGYQTLIDALEQKILALGGEVHAGATVESIASDGGRAVGVVVDGRLTRFDHVLCTLAPPMAHRLLAPELAAQAPGRPLPLPRRRLPAAADEPQRQPLLPPQHHRQTGPADDRRGDDARRRSRKGRRAPALRLEVRRPRPPGPAGLPGGARAEATSATPARSSPTYATTRSSRRSCSGRG